MGAVAVGRVTLSGIDAVTIDAYGTLMALVDPVEKLHALLPDHEPEAIRRAFETEAAYYLEHSHEGRDEASLARLHANCTAVFNETLGSSLTPDQYVGALEFEVLPGVREALGRLRAYGLALAVVANWDFSLHAHLRAHRLDGWFDSVIVSGELGVRKPDPAPFAAALERLGVSAPRAVHIGDHAPHDKVGAHAAGMRFEPAPLPAAIDRQL
jgi:HAD superfamily hydrolase (TIGR01549 family)